VNASRAAWLVAERKEDAGKRMFLPAKANLAPRRKGLVYQLVPLDRAEQDLALAGCTDLGEEDRRRLAAQLYRVRWLGETEAEADQIFADAGRRPSDPDPAKAAAWLRDRLAKGPVPSSACATEGNQALGLDRGLKWWRDAILKDRLGGKPRLAGFGPKGTWFFTLPGHPWPPPENPPPPAGAQVDSLDSLFNFFND
jgi:hypothetical protein